MELLPNTDHLQHVKDYARWTTGVKGWRLCQMNNRG